MNAPPCPARLVYGLAVGQMVSWGVLYYAFSVLLVPMQRDLGWSRSVLVGGFTLAVVASALLAPAVGRYLDGGRVRRLMTAGSIWATTTVLFWAASTSVAAYYAAWIGIGVAMALVLYEPAFTVLAKQCAPNHQRAITSLTLVAGLSSFVFQPLTSALSEAHGWRTTLAVLALVLAASTIPIHAGVLPSAVAPGPPARRRGGPPRPTEVSDGRFWPLTGAFTGASAASFGTAVLLIAYLVDHGWTLGRAALAGGTLGAMQLPGRFLYGPLRTRLDPAALVPGLLALPAAGVLLLVASAGGVLVWPAVAMLGAAQGVATLMRPSLMVDLYGAEQIGILNGLSAKPIILARALAPLATTFLVGATGGYAVPLVLLAAIALTSATTAWRTLRPAALPHSVADRAAEVPPAGDHRRRCQ
jgi:hypothetical protein